MVYRILTYVSTCISVTRLQSLGGWFAWERISELVQDNLNRYETNTRVSNVSSLAFASERMGGSTIRE